MLCERYPNQTIVIVIDNLPVYINARIPAAIKKEGHIIYYLPLYSPDFNLIDLMWAVLKA